MSAVAVAASAAAAKAAESTANSPFLICLPPSLNEVRVCRAKAFPSLPPLQTAGSRRSEVAAVLRLDGAHHVVHPLERRIRLLPRLLRAHRQKPLQLALVRTQRVVALPDRVE